MSRYTLKKLLLAKGGHSSYEQQQADQQRAMENNLMQQQLGMQQKQLAGVNAAVDPIIAQGGMSPQQQAALTSQMMNNIPNQFRGIQGNINNQLVARGITGGSNAGGGQIAQQFGQLGAMEAGLQQSGIENIQQQKYQQLMQSLGMKMGIGGQFGQNVGGFNSGAIGAGNTATTAANNADQAQTQFMGSLMGALTSPFSIAGKLPCWIARAVYGENEWQPVYAQQKLFAKAETSLAHRLMLAAYIAIGEPVAWLVKRSSILRDVFRIVFDEFIYGR